SAHPFNLSFSIFSRIFAATGSRVISLNPDISSDAPPGFGTSTTSPVLHLSGHLGIPSGPDMMELNRSASKQKTENRKMYSKQHTEPAQIELLSRTVLPYKTHDWL